LLIAYAAKLLKKYFAMQALKGMASAKTEAEPNEG
jgi:hypothetical protein